MSLRHIYSPLLHCAAAGCSDRVSKSAYERNTYCFKATFSRWNQFTFTSYTEKIFFFFFFLPPVFFKFSNF